MPVPSTAAPSSTSWAPSGLRGRGGAGFPVGRKWQTVIANSLAGDAAHGRRQRRRGRTRAASRTVRSSCATRTGCIEGALIAAHAVGADSVIIATKAAFTGEVRRLEAAIAEIDAEGWTSTVPVSLVTGPERVPVRRGDRAARGDRRPSARSRASRRRTARASTRCSRTTTTSTPAAAPPRTSRWRAPAAESIAPPTLAGNVETFANVPGIVRFGADWFRELGTDASPGTVVCTVSGDTVRAGRRRGRARAPRCAR